MGLTFKKLEQIQFGDLVATPRLTNELKLRIQAGLGNSEKPDGLAELTKNLAAAFPDNKDDVAKFIEEEMTMDSIAQLATYLLAGDNGLARLDAAQGGANGSE